MTFLTDGTIGFAQEAPRRLDTWLEAFQCRGCGILYANNEKICQSCGEFSWEPIAMILCLLPSSHWWQHDKFKVETKPRSLIVTSGA